MTRTDIRRLILVAGAVAFIVAQEVIGYSAAALAQPWGLTRTIVHTLAGLAYAVCAWLAWQTADSPVPGRLMIAVAFLWLPPTFIAAIADYGALWPLAYSVGLVWAVIAAMIVAVYPTGRFPGRIEKWVIIVGAVACVIRMVAILLFDPLPPDGVAGAPNVYAIFANEAIYSAIDRGFRLVGVLLILVIFVIVMVRWVRGSTPARTIAFIMPVALLLWAVGAAYTSLAYSFGTTVDTLANYISVAATGVVPISFVAGLIFIRSLRGRVSDLMVLTRDGVDRQFWQRVLAETLRDNELQVYWWNAGAGRYEDAAGEPVPPASDARARGRAMMAIDSPDGRLALIDHDVALSENTELLDAVSTALRLSVDNRRLREELEDTLQEVRDSRLRIIQAGLDARRRIERDLHDGSQQSLVSLALSLRMAIGKARSAGQDDLGADLELALDQLTDALRQLRELARGIHPSSLSVGGLGMAVGELVNRSIVPVDSTIDVPSRLPQLTESTVYFFVAECLTNIAKYADATRASVVLVVGEHGMTVSVGDDGAGGARMEAGTGLRGLVDRMEALGGTVELVSAPGEGTTVTAKIPPEALHDGDGSDYGIQRAEEAMR